METPRVQLENLDKLNGKEGFYGKYNQLLDGINVKTIKAQYRIQ